MSVGAATKPLGTTGSIRKPDTDDRTYRAFTLAANQLQVLVISDPSTDKSAAALDVRVGHLSDPPEAQGLAHFLEHLLFMGTAKYPAENEYSRYLNEHGGASNAFTGMENTNYFFDVANHGFEGAVDRFAQFFIAPLFDESCTERERNAVDSEHKKNLQSDVWRKWQLEKDLCHPAHPYTKFGTGNRETLGSEVQARGLDIRRLLLDFHATHYSANLMSLVLLGPGSVEELERLATQYFSAVPNKGYAAPSFAGPNPLEGSALMGAALRILPIKDSKSVELLFPCPPTRPAYRTKPDRVLSHLIGHEAQGSILALLKHRGWALGLSAGAWFGGQDFGFFRIHVECTPAGMANVPAILTIVFDYVLGVLGQGIPQSVFDEVAMLALIDFKTKEKQAPSSYASDLAGQLQLYPSDEVLSGPCLMEQYDAALIQGYLAHLRPGNMVLKVLDKALTPGSAGWCTAKYYGTQYELVPLAFRYVPTPDLASDAAAPAAATTAPADAGEMPTLHLPLRNPFIPTSFAIIPKDVAFPRTCLPGTSHVLERLAGIWESARVRCWYSGNDFDVPKAHVYINLHTPALYDTPLHAVQAALFVMLFKERMIPLSYNASVAGLEFDVSATRTHFALTFHGYHDKLPLLVEQVVGAFHAFLRDPTMPPGVYDNLRDKLRRRYDNWSKDAPYNHAIYWTSLAVEERIWTVVEKLAAMAHLPERAGDLPSRSWAATLWMEVLVAGNITAAEGRALCAVLEAGIPATLPALPEGLKQVQTRTILLPACPTILRMPAMDEDNINAAIEYYVQVPGDAEDVGRRALVGLLTHMMSEPCFDVLRTQEALGYLVFSSLKPLPGTLGLRILIQSERHPAYLEARIEAFLATFHATILGPMGEEEWARHVKAYEAKLLERDKNLIQRVCRLYNAMGDGTFALNRRIEVACELPKLRHADMVRLYEEAVLPTPTHRKLSVHVISTPCQEEERASSGPWATTTPTSALLHGTAHQVMEGWGPNGDWTKTGAGAALWGWRQDCLLSRTARRAPDTTFPLFA